MSRPEQWWHLACQHRGAGRGLAVMRSGYGLMVLAVLAVNAADWQRLWGPTSPWGPDDARARFDGWVWSSPFLVLDSAWWTTSLLLLLGAGAVAMVLGWHSRVAVVVVAVLWQSLDARNFSLLNGGDALAASVLVYLCFASSGSAWSLDARRRGRPTAETMATTRWQVVTLVHNGALVAVVAQVVVVYVASSVYKLQGEVWRDGSAVYWALRPSDYSPFPLLSQLLWQQGWLVEAVTYGTVALQLLFPVALLHRWSRRAVLLATTGMHASIGLLLGLPAFSFVMITTEAVLVHDREWLALAALLRREAAAVLSRGGRSTTASPPAVQEEPVAPG